MALHENFIINAMQFVTRNVWNTISASIHLDQKISCNHGDNNCVNRQFVPSYPSSKLYQSFPKLCLSFKPCLNLFPLGTVDFTCIPQDHLNGTVAIIQYSWVKQPWNHEGKYIPQTDLEPWSLSQQKKAQQKHANIMRDTLSWKNDFMHPILFFYDRLTEGFTKPISFLLYLIFSGFLKNTGFLLDVICIPAVGYVAETPINSSRSYM